MNGFYSNDASQRDATHSYGVRQDCCGRPGFTLIELLVSAAIAMSVMGVVASLFALFGRSASNGQSIVDMSGRMRTAADKLSQDLKGLTVRLLPPANPESATGYFELIEGPVNDAKSSQGDCDDALLFTTRSTTRPFVGRYRSSQLESPVAEVAWFSKASPTQVVSGLTLYTIYRRQLLVTAYVGAEPFFVNGRDTNNQIVGVLPAAYNNYDLSLRVDPVTSALVPNSLADLTLRENRFCHSGVPPVFSSISSSSVFDSTSGREGEDVVLTNVLAFDIRVFDPKAPTRVSSVTTPASGSTPSTTVINTVIYPTDPGWEAGTVAAAPAPSIVGGFVDLGTGSGTTQGSATNTTQTSVLTSPSSNAPFVTTYDTWSTLYESDGIGDDLGSNGVDDNGDSAPDDPSEAEDPPPSAVPLRGIEVRIRCYDPSSKLVRQVTVRQIFSR